MYAYIDSFRKFGKTNTDNQSIKIKRPYPEDRGLFVYIWLVRIYMAWFEPAVRRNRPPVCSVQHIPFGRFANGSLFDHLGNHPRQRRTRHPENEGRLLEVADGVVVLEVSQNP